MPTSKIPLNEIWEKVLAGERLSFDDGLRMYDRDVPLNALGELANLVRERKNGNFAYYNINTHLNPTNVCVYRCSFCAFRSDLRDPKGYVMDDDQILARGQEAIDNGCTEIHIVGGLHHQRNYDWYLNIVRYDYSVDAWEGPPESVLGWWKSQMPDPNARKLHWAPNDVILHYFEQLNGKDDQQDVRYVLALLMVRRRIVRLEDTEQDENGEIFVLYCPRKELEYRVDVVEPTPDRVREIQEEVARLLFAGAA